MRWCLRLASSYFEHEFSTKTGFKLIEDGGSMDSVSVDLIEGPVVLAIHDGTSDESFDGRVHNTLRWKCLVSNNLFFSMLKENELEQLKRIKLT